MADLPITRILGPLQVSADPADNAQRTGFIFPSLTTAAAQALAAQSPSIVQNGYTYYDTNKKGLYVSIDGKFEELYTAAEPAGGFELPTGTTVEMEVAANAKSGFLYYNTDIKNIRTYVGPNGAGAWATVYSSPNTTTNAGLNPNNCAFILPTSGQTDVVERDSGNNTNGFIYYNDNTFCIRAFTTGDWGIIPSGSILEMPDKFGTGFIPGNSPLILPSGDGHGPGYDGVEDCGGNDVGGFTYLDLLTNSIRTFLEVGPTGRWANINAIAYMQVSASHTIIPYDTFVGVDPHSAGIVITLPPISSVAVGQIFYIKDVTGWAATHPFTISGGGVNIDSSADITISTNYGGLTVLSNGTQWLDI